MELRGSGAEELPDDEQKIGDGIGLGDVVPVAFADDGPEFIVGAVAAAEQYAQAGFPGKEVVEQRGTLLASGFIAGEAIMAILSERKGSRSAFSVLV